jgi:hypothetical protein
MSEKQSRRHLGHRKLFSVRGTATPSKRDWSASAETSGAAVAGLFFEPGPDCFDVSFLASALRFWGDSEAAGFGDGCAEDGRNFLDFSSRGESGRNFLDFSSRGESDRVRLPLAGAWNDF